MEAEHKHRGKTIYRTWKSVILTVSASLCRASTLRFEVNLADAASLRETWISWNNPHHVQHSWKDSLMFPHHITTLVLVCWSMPRGCVLFKPNIYFTISCDSHQFEDLCPSHLASWRTVIVAAAYRWFVSLVPFAAWVYIVADCETSKTDG